VKLFCILLYESLRFRVEKRGFRDKIKERDKISCKIKKKEERDSNGLREKWVQKMIPANKLGSSVAESDGVRKDQKRVYHKNGGLTI